MTIQRASNQEVVISGTWNSASAYNSVIIDTRDVSSNVNSDLLDLRLNGVTKANITKGGMINTTSSVSALGTIYAATVNGTTISGTTLRSPILICNTLNDTTQGAAISLQDSVYSIKITPDPLQGNGFIGLPATTSGTTGRFVTLSATTYQNLPLAAYALTASLANYATTALYATTASLANYATTAAARFVNLSATTLSATTYLNLPSTGGSPGGSNTQVQFNANGAFGGNAYLTYTSATRTLSAANVVVTSGIIVSSISAIGGTYIKLNDGGNAVVINPDSLNGNDGAVTIYGTISANGFSSGIQTGITQQVDILDGDAVTLHRLTFTNGLLTSYTN